MGPPFCTHRGGARTLGLSPEGGGSCEDVGGRGMEATWAEVMDTVKSDDCHQEQVAPT